MGGVSQRGELLLGPARDVVQRRLRLRRQPEIVVTKLGADIGVKGAHAYARHHLDE